MKAKIPGTMTPRQRLSAAMKVLMGKKHRMMSNNNVHVITPHGKVMTGRKGRKT